MKYQVYITGAVYITVMLQSNQGAERCSRHVEYDRHVASTLEKRTDSGKKRPVGRSVENIYIYIYIERRRA